VSRRPWGAASGRKGSILTTNRNSGLVISFLTKNTECNRYMADGTVRVLTASGSGASCRWTHEARGRQAGGGVPKNELGMDLVITVYETGDIS
jgi:hypothetical protein